MKYVRTSGCSVAPLGDDWLVQRHGLEEVHVLNRTAGKAWEVWEVPCTKEEVITQIIEEFDDADSSKVSGDIEKLIQEFLSRGLLTQV